MDLGRDVEAEEETVVEIENSPSCLKRAFYCLLPACLKNKKTAAEQVIIRVPSQKKLINNDDVPRKPPTCLAAFVA